MSFFFQAEDGIRDYKVTGVQTCALPILFTVENTHPRFGWLVNYFETILSATLWMPSTSATNAMHVRELLDEWAEKVGAPNEIGRASCRERVTLLTLSAWQRAAVVVQQIW